MSPSAEDILAEAERGDVVCRLYHAEGGRPGVKDEDGFARDALCRALCEQGPLRFAGWKGQRTSPLGMW